MALLHYAPSTPSRWIERLLEQAEVRSREWRHFYVGVEHLFIALLENPTSQLSSFLRQQGLAPEMLRQRIRARLEPGDPTPRWQGILITPRLQDILRRAEEIARERGEGEISELSFLSAAWEEGNSLPLRVLREMLPWDAVGVKEAIHRWLQGPSPEAPSPLAPPSEEEAWVPCPHREQVYRQLMAALLRRWRRCPLLVAPPGAGKSTLLHHLVVQGLRGGLPQPLRSYRPFLIQARDYLSPSFPQNLEGRLSEGWGPERPLLCFDDLPLPQESPGLPLLLLAEEVAWCGSALPQVWEAWRERFPALEERVSPLSLPPLPTEEVQAILLHHRPRLEEHHGVAIAEEALPVLLEASFPSSLAEPGRSLNLLDEACAWLRLQESEESPPLLSAERLQEFLRSLLPLEALPLPSPPQEWLPEGFLIEFHSSVWDWLGMGGNRAERLEALRQAIQEAIEKGVLLPGFPYVALHDGHRFFFVRESDGTIG